MKRTISVKLYNYLEKNPKDYDVTFCVGPEKVEVKAVKMILKAASSVFEEEFNKNWECAVSNGDHGIPLPDIDATAFELFIKLLITDAWSAKVLKKLPINTLLNLVAICRRFGLDFEMQIVEAVINDYIPLLDSFVKTDEFLQLPRNNLETLLSSDLIPMEEVDIFNAVQRWAEFQCSKSGFEVTGENLRLVLGGCLFQIRFPIMSSIEFRKANRQLNILTPSETLEIYDFMSMEDDEKLNCHRLQCGFKTQERTKLFRYSLVSVTDMCELVSNPPFKCDWHWKSFYFKPQKKIALQSIGFLGPIKEDSVYRVRVQIQQSETDYIKKYESKILEKQIMAKKGEVFHFVLDDPVILESCSDELFSDYYRDFCTIEFALAGPDTLAFDKNVSTSIKEFAGQVKVGIFQINDEIPLAELRVKPFL